MSLIKIHKCLFFTKTSVIRIYTCTYLSADSVRIHLIKSASGIPCNRNFKENSDQILARNSLFYGTRQNTEVNEIGLHDHSKDDTLVFNNIKLLFINSHKTRLGYEMSMNTSFSGLSNSLVDLLLNQINSDRRVIFAIVSSTSLISFDKKSSFVLLSVTTTKNTIQ